MPAISIDVAKRSASPGIRFSGRIAKGATASEAVKGKTLNKAKLKELVLTLPPLPEQRKIATILSSVDEVIEKTEAVIENVRRILKAAGASLDDVIDVTAFLIDMDRDFKAYNAVYAKHFTSVGATRTTLAISALPTPIAVEFKVVARAPVT